MWRDVAYLLDMSIAAQEAREFSQGVTREEFRESSLHQHAIAKALENIGEAARKVSEETKLQHSEIPWAQVIALRHRIAHDLVRVWETVQNEVPALMELPEGASP